MHGEAALGEVRAELLGIDVEDAGHVDAPVLRLRYACKPRTAGPASGEVGRTTETSVRRSGQSRLIMALFVSAHESIQVLFGSSWKMLSISSSSCIPGEYALYS